MSKQLTVASAFSVFALAALALFGQGSASLTEIVMPQGAATYAAAPAFSAQLTLPQG